MPLLLQPSLLHPKIALHPLEVQDFETLYALASEPEVWAQHPNKERWRREVFQTFFEGAMQSQGALKVLLPDSDTVIGSTRYYNYQEADSSILIGYTFYGRAYWGKGYNLLAKSLMLDYIFQFVKNVYFHIGAGNVRSQIAIGRLGAAKVAEQEIAYFGENPAPNYIYHIGQSNWQGLGTK